VDDRSESDRGSAVSPGDVREHFWVLRAQLGDVGALSNLVAAYQGRVLLYVEAILGSRDDAEDALQDIWVAVVRKIAKLDDPRAFRAWLYRIARNRALSELRRKKREGRQLAGAEDGTSIADHEAHEDEAWFREFDPREMHAAIGDLSPAHREAITLRYFQGMGYEEISEIANCSIGTIRSRIHYAKKTLRDRLKQP
jgi:RNA polymerase sigma-70 factor (ECF subfamily)